MRASTRLAPKKENGHLAVAVELVEAAGIEPASASPRQPGLHA